MSATGPGGVAGIGGDGWFEALLAAGASLPEVPGATARIEITPDGPSDVPVHHVVLRDGRLVAAGAGPLEDAELQVRLAASDVVELWSGRLDLAVAFMQGRAKVAGPTSVLLRLLPALSGDAWREALAALAGRTEPDR